MYSFRRKSVGLEEDVLSCSKEVGLLFFKSHTYFTSDIPTANYSKPKDSIIH